MAKRYTLHDSQKLPVSAEKLMIFFSVPENLARITPESMEFKVVSSTTRPIEEGTVLEYRVKKFGSYRKWKSYIREWKPGDYFVDVQQEGPFKHWEHKHILKPIEGGTEVIDELQYEVPFGIFGKIGHSLLLRNDIIKSFNYRKKKMEELFGEFPLAGGN